MSSSFQISKDNSKMKFSRAGTFADLLVRYIRERKGGDAPSVYTVAQIDRRTYSSIVSNPFRIVSKRTAILFALALGLGRNEADSLLLAAGYAFSPALPEDRILAESIAAGECDVYKINARLVEEGVRSIL